MFWGTQRTTELQQLIFGDSDDAHVNSIRKTRINALYNMITLSPDAHTLWGAGDFILEPLGEDKIHESKAIFRQMPVCEGPNEVSIKFEISSFQINYANVEPLFNNVARTVIEDGHEVTFSTSDPITKPLPSRYLLELQSFLIRILRLAGRAGNDMLETFDSDRDVSSLAESHIAPSVYILPFKDAGEELYSMQATQSKCGRVWTRLTRFYDKSLGAAANRKGNDAAFSLKVRPRTPRLRWCERY